MVMLVVVLLVKRRRGKWDGTEIGLEGRWGKYDVP